MIAVFGATGQTGGEVVRQLAAQNIPARALLRDAHKAASKLSGLNVEVAEADLAWPEQLENALRSAGRAYFVTSGKATGLSENFYSAASRAGVQHIVRLSGSYLVGPDSAVTFDRWHYQAEQTLERSGLASWQNSHAFSRASTLSWVKGSTGAFSKCGAGTDRIGLVTLISVLAQRRKAARVTQ
jgi:uncharacterized protein YbjT (DUF2867 family)